MVHYIITPWRHRPDLLAVRRDFYPSSEEGGNSEKVKKTRDRAVALVSIWEQKGNCPHLVASTALLVAAVGGDRDRGGGGVEGWCVRAAYAAAFSRFVTGLLDGYQTKKTKQSMYSIAKTIGLPATFVELRHQATHEDLPSLHKLRVAAKKALLWIWEFYWRGLGGVDGDDDDGGEERKRKGGVDAAAGGSASTSRKRRKGVGRGVGSESESGCGSGSENDEDVSSPPPPPPPPPNPDSNSDSDSASDSDSSKSPLSPAAPPFIQTLEMLKQEMAAVKASLDSSSSSSDNGTTEQTKDSEMVDVNSDDDDELGDVGNEEKDDDDDDEEEDDEEGCGWDPWSAGPWVPRPIGVAG